MWGKIWSSFESGMDFVTKWLNQITLTLVLFNVVIIIADVIGRYFFSRCVRGAHEIVQFSFMYAGLMTWGYCEMHGQLIRVDFVANLLPKKFMAYVNVIMTVVGMVAASLLGWRLWMKAMGYLKVGQKTVELMLPEWPFLGFAALIGLSVFVLALLITLKNNIREVIKK